MARYRKLPFGFHIGAGGGNKNGLGDYAAQLNRANIPFAVMSANEMPFNEQELAKASSTKHFVGFRFSEPHNGQTPPSHDVENPDYTKAPAIAALEHASWHCDRYPPELDGSITWVTDVNEPRHKEADHPGITEWLAEFSIESAKYHWSRGYKYVALNYAGGNHPLWAEAGPKMKELYRLAAGNPDRLMIGTHEYSWTEKSIINGDGYLVGRIVTQLVDHMPDVPVVVTEFGWSQGSVPEPSQAMQDILLVANTYYNREAIKHAAIWYLGPGFLGIADKAQRLISPLTDLTLSTDVEIHEDNAPPVIPPEDCDPRLGDARVPYTRVYWRVNSNATLDQWLATCKEAYEMKSTVGFSNDDAGIGVGLKRKKIIEVGGQYDSALMDEWYKGNYGVDNVVHVNYPGTGGPVEPPTGNSDVRYGIHTSADSRLFSNDLEMMRAMNPRTIKLLSGFPENQVGQIVREWPNAHYIVRAFLSFGNRVVTPENFYDWTITDVVRTVDTLVANGVEKSKLSVELHNEPNLASEGLYYSWHNGTGFGDWLVELAVKYKQALGSKVNLLYPGLSPGTEIGGIRKESKTFFNASKHALSILDGVALHGYWSPAYDKYTHEYAIMKTVDWYNSNSNGMPLHITEACNNSGGVSRNTKANEYTEVWKALKSRPNVKTISFFVLSASNPDWGDGGTKETWNQEMAIIAGRRFG